MWPYALHLVSTFLLSCGYFTTRLVIQWLTRSSSTTQSIMTEPDFRVRSFMLDKYVLDGWWTWLAAQDTCTSPSTGSLWFSFRLVNVFVLVKWPNNILVYKPVFGTMERGSWYSTWASNMVWTWFLFYNKHGKGCLMTFYDEVGSKSEYQL